MRPKLELSVAEMRQLRNDGYSNKDIARILDVSIQTVYTYIGKQGCRIPSATASFISKPKAEAQTDKKPDVTVISEVISIGGYLFELQRTSSRICVTFADGQVAKIDDAERFIGALKLAMEHKSGSGNNG